MRSAWTWLLLVALLGAAGAGVYAWRAKATGSEKPKYVTAPVEQGAIVARVTATGTLSALVTVQVGAQVSGRVLALLADFNSKVTKGQVLARLDPELFEAAHAQAQANEKAAEANVAKAKAQAQDAEKRLKRAQTLWGDKLISQAELDAAESEVLVAHASVAAVEGSLLQAKASRAQAQVNLTYTTIRSPIDGTVISRAVDVGQTVAASLQAPTLFTIAENLTRMQVDTSVSEADVGKLKEGLDATFTVDAFPQRPFKGRIRQIRYAPTVVQNVVTYDAVLDVDNPELVLRPGMTANVSFVWARADDVLKIPSAALRYRHADGKEPKDGAVDRARPKDGDERKDAKSVWVLKDGVPTKTAVKLGLSDGSFQQVLEGELAQGDLVIVDRQGADAAGGARPSGGGQGMGGLRRAF